MNLDTEQTAPHVIVRSVVSPAAALFKRTKLFQNKDIALQLEFPHSTLSKEKILNYLNFIHFKREPVLIHLFDPRNHVDYIAEALPGPVLSEELTCRWVMPNPEISLRRFQIRHVLIRREEAIVAIPVVVKKISDKGLTVKLPEESIPLVQRKRRRFDCCGVTARVMQDALTLMGHVQDCNAEAVRVALPASAYIVLSDIHLSEAFQLVITREDAVVFSGACRLDRLYLDEENSLALIFKPVPPDLPVSEEKILRNPRVHISPSATAIFHHPFSGKQVECEVQNVSNSGLLISEREDESLLIPGMVIPELVLYNASFMPVTCMAKVIYKRMGEDSAQVLCGLTILDMDLENYSRLTHLVNHHLDSHTHVSKPVDMDALWEFFFDTGFLYPEKYYMLEPNRDIFKETYRRLYTEGTDIARHFTYERNGQIYGHVSMLKAYSRTWLFHHHAARTMEGRMIGLHALKQIIHFSNGLSRFPSIHTDYILAFYQPQKAFPDRVYGNFARMINDRQACSLDLFECVPYAVRGRQKLSNDIVLAPSTRDDLVRLEQFYREKSGGLLLEAMGLTQQPIISQALQQGYSRMGLERDCRAVSIKRAGDTSAVAILERADIGVNLSEILNSIKLFVINPQCLSWDCLTRVLSHLVADYKAREVLVLVYPGDYLTSEGIVSKKQYQFCTLSSGEHVRHFAEYVVKNFRVKYA